MQCISILGGGWLGESLAVNLTLEQENVQVSKTTKIGVDKLKSKG